MSHRDGLESHPASRRQAPVKCLEVCGPPPLPHRLNHFNTDDGVVGSDDISIVLHSDIGNVAQLFGRYSTPRQTCLLMGQGHAGHPCSPPSGPPSQFTPPGSDFEQTSALSDAGRIKQSLDLVSLGLFERRVCIGEEGCRVRHRPVQKDREQVVREVVVPGDIARCPGAVILFGTGLASFVPAPDVSGAAEGPASRPGERAPPATQRGRRSPIPAPCRTRRSRSCRPSPAVQEIAPVEAPSTLGHWRGRDERRRETRLECQSARLLV